jgi:acyl-homoserine-lactone acylase
MNKALTSICLFLAIVLTTVVPINSRAFGQAKVSVPAEAVTAMPDKSSASDLWRQVEIIRTAHGVPHIRAENLRAAGYALAWLQSEDYGPRTAMNVLQASGQMAKINGRDAMRL